MSKQQQEQPHQEETPEIAYYNKDLDDVYGELDTSPKGLSREEAERRLEKYGRNELTEGEKVPKWRKFVAQFEDFLIIVLIFAAIISLVAGEYIESIVIWAILFANALLGYYQEAKAEEAIEALKEMGAPKALVQRSGKREDIFSFLLVPGDVVYLETGDRVPADGRIVEEANFRVDEAALTGESVPVKKKALTLEGEKIPVNDRKNMVFSSTIVTYGRAKIIITNTGMKAQIGRIAELLSKQEEGMTPLQKKLGKFGKQLGVVILIICAMVFLGEIFRGEDVLTSFLVAISLAVAAIPEGLPAVVTTTLAIGVQRMSKRNAIIRKLPATEALGCATTICSDKTGTLTRNEMTIRKVYFDFAFHEVTGHGYIPKGDIVREGKTISMEEDPTLKVHVLAGYLCNNASLVQDEKDRYQIQGDPTEGAFIVLGKKLGLTRKQTKHQYKRVSEVFFDSTRKRMSVVVLNDDTGKYETYTKGAPEIVLGLCNRILVEGKIRPLTQEDKDKILAANQEMGTSALRVLGTAFNLYDIPPDQVDLSPDAVEKDLVFVGLSGMIDPPRKEVKDAIELCKKASIKVVMITGDHALTAKAIALELSIIDSEEERTIQGGEIESFPDSELVGCKVFARVAPEHKMRIVNALQESGEVVAMTGDGVNDAPALRKADTGIAMGITGTDVAKEASSMILADDNFASIVASVEEGRGIYQNMKKFITFLISSNIAEVMAIFIGILLNLPLPIITVQILWINLVTDGFPALALGIDPYDLDIMERKPEDPKKNIINPRLTISILVRGAIITVVCLGLYFAQLQQLNPELGALDLSPLASLSRDEVLALTQADFQNWGLGGLWNTNQETYRETLLEYWEIAKAGGTLTWHDLPESCAYLWLPRSYFFATILICEMLNVFNCKSERHSVFGKSFFNNKWLIYSVLLCILLSVFVMYIPGPASVFRLAALTHWYDWFVVIALSFLTVLGEEVIKLVYRKYVYSKEER